MFIIVAASKTKNVYADETCEVEGLSLSFLTVVNGNDMTSERLWDEGYA